LAQSMGVASCAVVGDGEDDARGIIDAARERDCDVIVVACEGRNALVRLLNGSVVPGLISASPVPVLVCRDGTVPRMPGVLSGAQAQRQEPLPHVQ
jgi:nucleotide-binding universal stress UspA family protein